MVIKFQYFKRTGKYYSEGSLEVRPFKVVEYYDLVNQIRKMIIHEGKCPGLVDHAVTRNDFITVITSNDDELVPFIIDPSLVAGK